MRVMLLHKSTPDTEAGKVPPLDLIQRVGAMIGDMKDAGIFRDGAGLRSSAHGIRLTFRDGERIETLGPFVGREEDPAAFGILRVHSRDEAVAHATRFAQLLGDGECDIRPVTEPWDLGLMEKPDADPTMRYMVVWKADPRRKGADTLPSLQTRAALGKLIAELAAAGVFLQGEAFRGSGVAKRLAITPGKRRAVDGPFAESKELISGFCTIEVPTIADALPWADRYIAAVGEIELDVWVLWEADALRR